MLLLAAAEVSAGALSSAFAGAAGASAAVSLLAAAVLVSVVAVLEPAGLVLLPDFAVSSVTGLLSGWRAGDGAASGDAAWGAGFLSSGVGDALGVGWGQRHPQGMKAADSRSWQGLPGPGAGGRRRASGQRQPAGYRNHRPRTCLCQKGK